MRSAHARCMPAAPPRPDRAQHGRPRDVCAAGRPLRSAECPQCGRRHSREMPASQAPCRNRCTGQDEQPCLRPKGGLRQRRAGCGRRGRPLRPSGLERRDDCRDRRHGGRNRKDGARPDDCSAGNRGWPGSAGGHSHRLRALPPARRGGRGPGPGVVRGGAGAPGAQAGGPRRQARRRTLWPRVYGAAIRMARRKSWNDRQILPAGDGKRFPRDAEVLPALGACGRAHAAFDMACSETCLPAGQVRCHLLLATTRGIRASISADRAATDAPRRFFEAIQPCRARQSTR